MINDNFIISAIQSLKKVNNNKNLSSFLDSLDIEESRAYLYIEAQKSNVFLQEITGMKGEPLTIDDLKDEDKMKKAKSLLHNKTYIQNLIDFWDNFGKISAPSLEMKKKIIEKYEKYVKPLTENEKNFIINC